MNILIVIVTRMSMSMTGFYMDARAALDYIFSRSDICQQKVIVFGRSLGGAVALRVCSESFYATRVAAVIVENTFTSIADVARGMFDFRVLHYLPDWCYKNKVTPSTLVSFAVNAFYHLMKLVQSAILLCCLYVI